jgi:hypothetical protein
VLTSTVLKNKRRLENFLKKKKYLGEETARIRPNNTPFFLVSSVSLRFDRFASELVNIKNISDWRTELEFSIGGNRKRRRKMPRNNRLSNCEIIASNYNRINKKILYKFIITEYYAFQFS